MGYAKRLLMEEQARLYHTSEDAVCPRCFDDPGIEAFIKANLECNECSVCGRVGKRAIAARADRVLEFFLDRVHRHYQDADGNAPYDNEEGRWCVTTWTMHEIVFDELYEIAEFETLEWLYDHLKDDIVYCEQDWQILSPGQALTAGWEKFSEALKHETRFLFFSPEDDEDDSGEPYRVLPSEMLKELGEVILRCRLVRKVKKGTRLFRVRGHKPRKPLTTPKDLGPPPKEYATSAGRMNAPGIVVMYTAFESQTAIAEVTGRFGSFSTAEFELLQDILVVDLTKIPPVPSIFESGPRESLMFLRKFARDVSQPITPDKEVHVEYTPTQVVAEYLRHRFRTTQGNPIQGLLYESAQAKNGTNAALFVESEEIEGVPSTAWKPKTPLLRLVKVSERRRPRKNKPAKHSK